MYIELTPESERIVREEIDSGHFRSLDEIIALGLQVWYEKNPQEPGGPASDKK